MAIAAVPYSTQDFSTELDVVLDLIVEELQLSTSRYAKAEDRYHAVNRHLEAAGSPFNKYKPTIYAQGSMRLNTTVKPVDGPHDLDFVLELALSYETVDPMRLLQVLYDYLHQSEIYRPMLSKKKRCVRLEYADDFYMDILPACQNPHRSGTCIKVPDRELKAFTDSNPVGYADWFKDKSTALRKAMMDSRAQPIPQQQSVAEKTPLQLAVQLLKRERDLRYAGSDMAPISIVLTTLAANMYTGQTSVSEALLGILGGIVGEIAYADRRGTRVQVLNPKNDAEDFSEKWDNQPKAYQAFKDGIRDLEYRWRMLMAKQGNVTVELEKLFGEPVKVAFDKRATRRQEDRLKKALGVAGGGLIVPATSTIRPVPTNTFYGEEK